MIPNEDFVTSRVANGTDCGYYWVDDGMAGRFGPKSGVLFAIWCKCWVHDIETPLPQHEFVHLEPETVDAISVRTGC